MSTNLKLNPKKEISKIFLFLLFLFFNTSNIYAHGDYTQLVTNPFVFGASISTFIVFSFMVSLINKYWNPPMNLSYWKMGLRPMYFTFRLLFVWTGQTEVLLLSELN
jgi:hypothetical protein